MERPAEQVPLLGGLYQLPSARVPIPKPGFFSRPQKYSQRLSLWLNQRLLLQQRSLLRVPRKEPWL